MAGTVGLHHIAREKWDALTLLFRDVSYRQCGSYAELAAQRIGATSEFVAIFQGTELVGLANVRVKKVPFFPVGIAYVHYGPLTARGDEFRTEPFEYCLDALRREYVEGRRLMMRIVPPLRGGQWAEAQAACLETHGFHALPQNQSRETFILDLVNPLSEIHKKLDGKWRSDLLKAQRSKIDLTKSVAPADFDRFEALFIDLTKRKGFTAHQDVAFFKCVQENASSAECMVMHLASYAGELVAGHIGSFVGDTAVYLLGAANSKGRELRASYLLQWAAIEHAKSFGNVFYDVGGIDPETNPDVYRFKRRLNGRRVAEIGPYELAPTRLTGSAVHIFEAAYNLIGR